VLGRTGPAWSVPQQPRFPQGPCRGYLIAISARIACRGKSRDLACGFFAANALPVETTKGTRLRIAEVLKAGSHFHLALADRSL